MDLIYNFHFFIATKEEVPLVFDRYKDQSLLKTIKSYDASINMTSKTNNTILSAFHSKK